MREKDEELNDPERGRRFHAVCQRLFEPGATNIALAEAFGCSEAAIRKWNDGQPINGILVKLLAALGISEKYLLDGVGPMFAASREPPGAKTIGPELRRHLNILRELREILHDYEIDVVRGAVTVDDFGEFIHVVAEAAGKAGKKLEKRGRNKDVDSA